MNVVYFSPVGITGFCSARRSKAGSISNSIIKFYTEGNYMGLLQHPDLTFPQGVAFDDKGHLFSTSLNQNNIVEFDTAGMYVRTITEG